MPSSCFMLVLDGALTETVYESSAFIGQDAVALNEGHSRTHSAGAYTYINDRVGLHKVENATRDRAMSLHIYAPGWKTVQLYDEVQRPELTDASGASFEVGWGDF